MRQPAAVQQQNSCSKVLQRETLERIHAGHQGIERCRARVTVWPGVMHSIAQLVQNCRECTEQSKNKREPLITTPLPDYPWQLYSRNRLELDKCRYLLVVDYFSRYPEVVRLSSTTSSQVIAALKTLFARHAYRKLYVVTMGLSIHRKNLLYLQAVMDSTMLQVAPSTLKVMGR